MAARGIRHHLHASAFTLVELLVVIAILGVLATITLAAFRSSQARGRDAQRKSDLKQMASALELFYSDYAQYPTSTSNSINACPFTITTKTGSVCSWGSSEFRDVDGSGNTRTTYFKVLPKDPLSSNTYYYKVDSTKQMFQLFAYLENSQDPTLIKNLTEVCGPNPCNFSVTSPNTTPQAILQ